MHFVFPVANALQEACGLQHLQMLGDGLSRQRDLVLHCEARAELEEGLAIPLDELVENRPPRWSRDRVEDIAQLSQYRQVLTCLSRHLNWSLMSQRSSVQAVDVFRCALL